MYQWHADKYTQSMAPKPLSPKQIKELRLSAGLSQEEAADRVGVNRVTWTRWENGTRVPSSMACAAIRALFPKKD
jgi:DNA-binding transcriptional regulator YiaG